MEIRLVCFCSFVRLDRLFCEESKIKSAMKIRRSAVFCFLNRLELNQIDHCFMSTEKQFVFSFQLQSEKLKRKKKPRDETKVNNDKDEKEPDETSPDFARR